MLESELHFERFEGLITGPLVRVPPLSQRLEEPPLKGQPSTPADKLDRNLGSATARIEKNRIIELSKGVLGCLFALYSQDKHPTSPGSTT